MKHFWQILDISRMVFQNVFISHLNVSALVLHRVILLVAPNGLLSWALWGGSLSESAPTAGRQIHTVGCSVRLNLGNRNSIE
jgi:hypothetical protein